METGTYGVILWSDPDGGQAVIWCEDRGDLAYYQAPEHPDHVAYGFFDAGDYVEFEVTEEASLRRARNPYMLKSAQVPRVSQTLQQEQPAKVTPARNRAAGQIIDISDRLAAKVAHEQAINRRD